MTTSNSSPQDERPTVWKANAEATSKRIAALLAQNPTLAQALPERQAITAIQQRCKHTISMVEAICALYHARPALAWRPASPASQNAPAPLPPFAQMTYGALWQRVGRLATALATHDLAGPGRLVGVWGHASPSWLVADLACLYLAATGAPLQTSLPLPDLAALVQADKLHTIFCSTAQLPQMAKLIAQTDVVRTVIVMDEDIWPLTPEQQAARQSVAAACHLTTVEQLEAETGHAEWATMRRPGEDGVPADTLVSLLYTSGSTGLPKGAMFTDDLWRENFCQSFLGDMGEVPWINYAYLPLNHLAGLGILFSVMSSGGISYFAAKPDMSYLFEDLREVRPTVLMLVPRVSSLLYQRYNSALQKRLAAGASQPNADAQTATRRDVMASMRDTALGDRLVMILMATAPTTTQVSDFLRDCFDVPTFDTFGQTENGGLLFAGHVLRNYVTEYKLVDVPELGYLTTDKPYPRGELCIKSKRMIAGYYNNPEATAALFDEAGFMKTGDIMQERAPDVLAWVDRKRNILKLAQGEFVSLSRLEGLYADNSPYVEQVYMYGKSSASYVLAAVALDEERVAQALARISDDDRGAAGTSDTNDTAGTRDARRAAAVKRLVLQDLARVAHEHQLATYEIPRDLVISPAAFTRENGLLTESNKPARPHLKERFGPALEALIDTIEARQDDAVASFKAQDMAGWSTRDKVLRAVGVALGIEHGQSRFDASFAQLGGDSIAAVTLSDLLQDAFSVAVPVGNILDPTATLDRLVSHLEGAALGSTAQKSARELLSYKTLHPDPSGPHQSDLMLQRLFPAELLRPEKRAKTRLRRQINHVLLTGATGFLGRFLLLELLRQAHKSDGHVTVIVRGADNPSAHARLVASMAAGIGAGMGAESEPGMAAGHAAERETHETQATFASLASPTRLTVLAGDFTRPDFGLTPGVYTRLSKNVDCVVHNGALVNHAYTYEQEFAPNVGGTVEVMRFALHGRRKILSYISSIAVAAAVPRTDTLLEKENPADWWPDFPPADGYAAGYGTSKWVCEVLLRQLHDVCGIPVNVFRPSMILGHSKAVGQINVADIFTRLLVSLVATKIAPPSFFVSDFQGSKSYDGMPVDFVAAAIAALSVQSHGPVQSYNVVNPHKNDASLDSIVASIEKAGYDLRRIDDYDTWYAAFHDKLQALPQTIKQHSLLPLVEMWRHPTVQAPTRVGTAQFRRDVALLTPYQELPHLDEAFVAQTLRHLQHWKLIPQPNAHRSAPPLPLRSGTQDDAVTT